MTFAVTWVVSDLFEFSYHLLGHSDIKLDKTRDMFFNTNQLVLFNTSYQKKDLFLVLSVRPEVLCPCAVPRSQI